MGISFRRSLARLGHLIPSITSTAITITVLGVSLPAQAGKITAVPSAATAPNAPGFVAQGFGGWNLDNVTVTLDGAASSFNETDGGYLFSSDSDFSYQASVYDGAALLTGIVLAKDWPIGEPSGIKIVNDDFDVKEPKPVNCIMATSYLADHYLNSTDPRQVLCSGPFQSHKRYKLAMLPATVANGPGSEIGVDLVFNVEEEEGVRDYQVFQKINNWTNHRLQGFTIQVGTGIGTDFTPASDEDSGVGVENLSLSVPEEIWEEDQLATFSAGLFGPPDEKHDRPAGYFDPESTAGFEINEYGDEGDDERDDEHEEDGEKERDEDDDENIRLDTLTSGDTLDSDYEEVPDDADDQFGPWLPSSMLPYGIFWDDDGNPETDAELVAWYGFNPELGEDGELGWMRGAADDFSAIPDATIAEWGQDLGFTEDLIDDLVNIGLNYIVTVGDVSSFPDKTFTIRITPAVDTSSAGPPAYVGVTPVPNLEFSSSEGIVALSPSPEFLVGSVLTARVGDADLNRDPLVAEAVDVSITTDSGLNATLTLMELGKNRGVFAANLPDNFSNVLTGTKVTVSYLDEDVGDGTSETRTASSTAYADATTDSDRDGVVDIEDNCILVANGPVIPDAGGNSQLDSDGDGYGNMCDADLNQDLATNGLDIGPLRAAMVTYAPAADFNGDGEVNGLDVGLFRGMLGTPPGPSCCGD